MSVENKPVTNRREQIEALLLAKSEVEDKLNSIFSEERERLTDVLRNMMRIDHDLTAQVLAAPMREVVAPLTNEAKTEMLEQIWTAVQEDLQVALPDQAHDWQGSDADGDEGERKGVA